MFSIEMQLIKTIIISKDKILGLKDGIQTLYKHAPKELYDYHTQGQSDLVIELKSEIFKEDFIPMLSDFYEEFGEEKYEQQYRDIIQRFKQYGEVSFEVCEMLGYKKRETFRPMFSDWVYTMPYWMASDKVNADCIGITIQTITPDRFDWLIVYNWESYAQRALAKHPLVKALKTCIH